MTLYPGLPGSASTRKVKPIWILLEQETVSGSGISWAICKSASHSRQITTPAPHHSVFTGRMPFLPPNQQRQSTEGNQNDYRAEWLVRLCVERGVVEMNPAEETSAVKMLVNGAVTWHGWRTAHTALYTTRPQRTCIVGGRDFPVAGHTLCTKLCLATAAAGPSHNSLLDNLIYAPSLSTFRQRLKTFLFHASFADIIIDPR